MKKLTRLMFLSLPILLLIFSFITENRAGVDTTFNAQVQTTTFRTKFVTHLITLSDGKTLASGNFNNYNGQSVGGLIRLNTDASLDSTFNNDLMTTGSTPNTILIQPDGRIILHGSFSFNDGTTYTNKIIRLNADGTIDNLFNISFTGDIYEVKLDAMGRVIVSGFIHYIQNGGTITKDIVRLSDTGAIDTAFDAQRIQNGIARIETQGNKIVYTAYDFNAQQNRLFRLSEDGSNDNSFTSTLVGSFQILEFKTQLDNKILGLADNRIFRVNENGGIDAGFQITNFPNQPRKIKLQSDGRITVAYQITSPFGVRVIRLLESGAADPSFTPYNFTGNELGGYAVQIDGGVILGDGGINSSSNQFKRLLPNGAVDATFNQGGTGFQNINPGKIRAINVLPDGKILIGGDFDRVNNINRTKIARLNADSTLDNSFQINTTATGNYFSQIVDVYHYAIQTDGKIIVSGNFTYVVNGAQKFNLARLNANGSIDSTFNLSLYITDWFATTNLGKNKPLQMPNGKILVGTSRTMLSDTMSVPLLLTSGGDKDTTFSPTIYNNKNSLVIFDTASQPDGKILIAGRHIIGDVNTQTRNGFIARLNSNGTIDSGFQPLEILDKDIFAFSLLPDGKILVVSKSDPQSFVQRLNSDGSLDNSFSTGIGANGKINAIAVLPDNKIVVGGLFTTYNNEPRQNLAVLNADGSLDESAGNTNREVLCLTVDNQGRVLIGGHFTSIQNDGQQFSRSYIARIIAAPENVRLPYFDFDGDGKTDISIFRPSAGEWWLNRSSTGQTVAAQFGQSSDKPAPADFTGDGKTDVAFFRPSTGEWFILRSEDASFLSFTFGASGDVAVVGDFDADGKADPAVFRPSSGEWFILKSSGGVLITTFGTAGDVPVTADYDGDGKTDIAIFRPSNGSWWYLRSIDNQFRVFNFGVGSDKPVQGDYTGDGKADIAIWRPSTGEWFFQRSEDNSFYSVPFGTNGDMPAPGDYDGDGKFDTAVFRPSSRTWYINRTTAGFLITDFGITGDQPVPNVFVP